MATKNGLLFLKDNQQHYPSFSNIQTNTAAANSQFTSLNLNEKSQHHSDITSSVQSQSISTSYNNENKNDSVVSDNSGENRNIQLNYKSALSNNHRTSGDEESRSQRQKSKNDSNKGYNSTLSLHIAAYENSIEPGSNDNSSDDRNQRSKKKSQTFNFAKKWKNIKQLFSSPAIQNPFEFPRQIKEEDAQTTDPEVMQFKASQKLFNPNESDTAAAVVESSIDSDVAEIVKSLTETTAATIAAESSTIDPAAVNEAVMDSAAASGGAEGITTESSGLFTSADVAATATFYDSYDPVLGKALEAPESSRFVKAISNYSAGGIQVSMLSSSSGVDAEMSESYNVSTAASLMDTADTPIAAELSTESVAPSSDQEFESLQMNDKNRHIFATEILDRAPCGLVNLTTLCYMNVILQSLFAITGFRRIILEANVENEVVQSLQKLFISMQFGRFPANSAAVFASTKWAKQENSFYQQDIEEFLTCFIDEIEAALKPIELDDELNNLMRGCTTTYTESKEFNYLSKSNTNFYVLQLNMLAPDETIITDLHATLKQYCRSQRLDGENCIDVLEHGKQPVDVCYKYSRLPPVLCIYLMRSKFDPVRGMVKIPDNFHFPKILDMNEYFAFDEDDAAAEKEDYTYVLQTIINHKGTGSGGHYTAYVNYKPTTSNYWYFLDDKNVEILPDKSVFKDGDIFLRNANGTPCMFFYIKKSMIQEVTTPVPTIRDIAPFLAEELRPFIIKIQFWFKKLDGDVYSEHKDAELTTLDIFEFGQEWLFTKAANLFNYTLDEFRLQAYERGVQLYDVTCSSKRRIAELPISNNILQIIVLREDSDVAEIVKSLTETTAATIAAESSTVDPAVVNEAIMDSTAAAGGAGRIAAESSTVDPVAPVYESSMGFTTAAGGGADGITAESSGLSTSADVGAVKKSNCFGRSFSRSIRHVTNSFYENCSFYIAGMGLITTVFAQENSSQIKEHKSSYLMEFPNAIFAFACTLFFSLLSNLSGFWWPLCVNFVLNSMVYFSVNYSLDDDTSWITILVSMLLTLVFGFASMASASMFYPPDEAKVAPYLLLLWLMFNALNSSNVYLATNYDHKSKEDKEKAVFWYTLGIFLVTVFTVIVLKIYEHSTTVKLSYVDLVNGVGNERARKMVLQKKKKAVIDIPAHQK